MAYVVARLMGRFGNQLMQYAYARAFAEQRGMPFLTEHWLGEKAFKLRDERPPKDARDWPVYDETTIPDKPDHDLVIRSYCMRQQCMIYTAEQFRQWFTFRDPILEQLRRVTADTPIVGHHRFGDYMGYGYPVVSQASYTQACHDHGLDASKLTMVSEENPCLMAPFTTNGLPFLPDFWRLVRAPVLLRGNSTFSWCAGVLNRGRVFSPVVEDATPDAINDCPFVEGNWPRIAPGFYFVTDLHMRQQ